MCCFHFVALVIGLPARRQEQYKKKAGGIDDRFNYDWLVSFSWCPKSSHKTRPCVIKLKKRKRKTRKCFLKKTLPRRGNFVSVTGSNRRNSTTLKTKGFWSTPPGRVTCCQVRTQQLGPTTLFFFLLRLLTTDSLAALSSLKEKARGSLSRPEQSIPSSPFSIVDEE